jgi:hypothetical protein
MRDFRLCSVNFHDHYPCVRIPLPWVVVLALAVISLTWWRGSAGKDFLTPPSDLELAGIRERVEAALPRAGSATDAISVPEQNRRASAVAKPLVEIGDVSSPPALDEYSDRAANGAAYMIELATLLEARGEFQRTLLAWERVLDHTRADDAQRKAAIDAIRRLKPTLPDWNTGDSEKIPVVLQAGTGKQLALSLNPVLESVALDFEKASSGLLAVSSKVNAARDNLVTNGPVPVAFWWCGPEEDSPSTDVLSFTVATPDSLRYDSLRTAYDLIRGRFADTETMRKPSPLPGEGDAMDAIQHQITRRHWRAFAESLHKVSDPAPLENATPSR